MTAIRVASVPATHVYVCRLAHPSVDRLVDPSGDDVRTPSFLDPAWLRAHAGSFDVMHVHFGFEFYGTDQLEAVCDELDRQRKPLVYTCHDLRNPNHAASEVQDAALEVWMRRATRIITLTGWAAARIAERFNRDAVVLPHPHVVPLDELRRRAEMPRPQHADRHRVGLHLKSRRANMLGAELLREALRAIAHHDDVRLRLDLHCDVVDPTSGNHDVEFVSLALRTVADAASPLDLHIHHYLSDDELWQLIAGVDSFLLPYRFGTHSGLLEACKDLGTAVIAPTCGAYADQGAHHRFVSDETGFDPGSLHAAIGAAIAAERPQPVPVERRAHERAEVAAAHLALYREALALARARWVA